MKTEREKSRLEKQPDLITNTDCPKSDDLSEMDVSHSAAQWLLNKGYPIYDIDAWDLAAKIYEANYV